MFYNDLKSGEEKEDLFVQRLYSLNYSYVFKPNACKWFDIIAVTDKGLIQTFEVKHDQKFQSTGNIAIELYFRGKPSGIYATLSEYFIYFLDDFYFVKSKDFRRWLFLNEDESRIVYGGDNKDSKILLLPVDKFKVLFTKFGGV